MLGTLVGLVEILAVVLVVDRILLAVEARGWISYRRKDRDASGDPPEDSGALP